MKLVRVTTNGRVSIPADMRKKHKLYPGRKVKLEIADGGLLIIPLATAEEIRANIGSLGLKGKILRSLREEKMTERQL